MSIDIKTKNISLTEAITDYTHKRLRKVMKRIEGDSTVQCDVELGKTTGHHNKGDIFRAEIHIIGMGKNVYAAVEKEDLYSAIDAVRDDILRELKSGKEKHMSMIRRGGARVKAIMKGMWPWGRNI